MTLSSFTGCHADCRRLVCYSGRDSAMHQSWSVCLARCHLG